MARTVGDEIADGADKLRLAGIPSPERDARWLMAACLGVPRDRLTLHVKDPLSGEAEFFYSHYINERLERRPVSRILGEREFWGRVFKVSDATLDPRPETETLVEIALSQPFSQMLDLGTGSGCILVSLLAERDEATGVGTDISPEAVLVAGENAAAAGVDDRLILPLSDWYSSIGGKFDLIVSNPPYIAASEMDELAPEVRDYDPRLALTDEDRQGRDLVVDWMRELGLSVSIDQIGNFIGVRAGTDDGPPVTTGSHVDTVATGGLYDGSLGVLAGLEVIATLNDAGIVTRRPVAVGAFTNEEGESDPVYRN